MLHNNDDNKITNDAVADGNVTTNAISGMDGKSANRVTSDASISSN